MVRYGWVNDQLTSNLREQRALLTFNTTAGMEEFILFIACIFKLSFYFISPLA